MLKLSMRLKRHASLVDLTPLVDVVFLMLIFFIVTSDILPLKSLNIENPKLDLDSKALTTQLLVVIDAQNVIYIGSKKTIVDLSTLKQNLKKEMQLIKERTPHKTPSLVLSVDKKVSYDFFLRIFSICQECNDHIRLVYQPNETSQNTSF